MTINAEFKKKIVFYTALVDEKTLKSGKTTASTSLQPITVEMHGNRRKR